MRYFQLFLLSLLIVVSFRVKAQTSDTIPYTLICKEFIQFSSGKKYRGTLSDYQADSTRFLTTKKGLVLQILPNSDFILGKKCKKKVRLPQGIYHNPSLTLGFLLPEFNYFSQYLFEEVLIGSVYGNFEPKATWKFQHRVIWMTDKPWVWSANLGVESYFQEASVLSFVPVVVNLNLAEIEKGYNRRFLSFPIGVGIQKHFNKAKKSHVYLPIDAGISIQSPVITDGTYKTGSWVHWENTEKYLGYHAQVGLGWIFAGRKREGFTFELNGNWRGFQYDAPINGIDGTYLIKSGKSQFGYSFRFGLLI